jgi:hypothetical protein
MPTGKANETPAAGGSGAVRELLPRRGYLHCEDTLSFVLSKPKLLPLKSFNMEKLERIQKESVEKAKIIMDSGNLN